jgi:hypothetical protein
LLGELAAPVVELVPAAEVPVAEVPVAEVPVAEVPVVEVPVAVEVSITVPVPAAFFALYGAGVMTDI